MGATTVGAALLAAGCAARMTPKGKACLGLRVWIFGLASTSTGQSETRPVRNEIATQSMPAEESEALLVVSLGSRYAVMLNQTASWCVWSTL